MIEISQLFSKKQWKEDLQLDDVSGKIEWSFFQTFQKYDLFWNLFRESLLQLWWNIHNWDQNLEESVHISNILHFVLVNLDAGTAKVEPKKKERKKGILWKVVLSRGGKVMFTYYFFLFRNDKDIINNSSY